MVVAWILVEIERYLMTPCVAVRRRWTYGILAAALAVVVACNQTDPGPDEEATPPAVESSSAPADVGVANLRPVIGVFSQETDTITDSDTIDPTVKVQLSAYRYMIPASYVNWIGQAGGRVLPILLDQPEDYYEDIFAKVSGVLFPGGNQGIDPDDIYTEEGEQLWQLAKRANDDGVYFPVWGTCLGFEELSVLETGDGNVISDDVVAVNLPLPLQYTPAAAESRLFSSMPGDVVQALEDQPIAFNSHEHGLLVSEYESNPALNEFFDLLSVDETPDGVEFVSTIEAKDYPFYGTQWHPEKNNFEWSQNSDYSNLNHSPDAIAVSQATAGFFLDEARKSPHHFPEAERDSLVYSADMLYTGTNDWIYEQVYVFCPDDEGCGT
jgi:gamma-glutamyl hydrolase